MNKEISVLACTCGCRSDLPVRSGGGLFAVLVSKNEELYAADSFPF